MGNKTATCLLLLVALIASACGQSETELAQAEQLSELEAQLEELLDREEAQDSVPAVEADDPATGPTADEEATGDSGGVAAGAAISPATGPNELADILESMIGPTDDLAQEMRRIDFSWPAITQLPDTSIIGFNFQTRDTGDGLQWRHETTVEFSTSADPQDVVFAYQTELAGLLPNLSEERVVNSSELVDGVPVFRASLGTFGVRWFEISATERSDGLAVVTLASGENQQDRAGVADGVLEALASVVAHSPLDSIEGAELNEVGFIHSSVFQTMTVGHDLNAIAESDVFAARDQAAAAAGWTLTREIGDTGGRAYLAPEIADRAENEAQISTFEPGEFVVRFRYRSPDELAAPGEPNVDAPRTTEVPANEVTSGENPAPVTVAAGEGLTAASTPDDVADLLDAIVGTTEDFSGELARVAVAWPPLSTLPDTEIETLRTSITGQFGLGWRQYTTVHFTTSATAEDAVLVIQTELAALFPGESGSSSTEQLDGQIRFAASLGEFDFDATEDERGGSRVVIRFNSGSGFEPEVLPPSVARLANFSPVSNSGEIQVINLTVSTFGTPEIEVVHLLDGFNEAQAREAEDAGAAAANWSFVSDTGSGRRYEVEGVDARALVTLEAFTAPDLPDVALVTSLFTG